MGLLQAKQKKRTCQLKSLMVVSKQHLSPQGYLLLKKTLIERAIKHASSPAPKWVKAQATALDRLNAKQARVSIKLEKIQSLVVSLWHR